MKKIIGFLNNERGDFIQNAIYIIIVVLAGVTFLTSFSGALQTKFTDITNKIKTVTIS